MNLLELLRRWQGLHHELLGLAQGCLQVLRQERLDDLEDLWAKRGRVFDRLEAAARRLEPVFADWPAGAGDLDPNQRAQAEAIIQEVRGVAGRLLELDRQVAQGLEAAKERTGGALKRLSDGRRLMDAYGRSGPLGPASFSKLS